MAEILCLYTMNFPDGNSEEFLMAELPYLTSRFDNILIYPIYEGDKKNTRTLPKNCIVRYHGHKLEEGIDWITMLLNSLSLLKIFLIDVRYYGLNKVLRNIKAWLIYSNKILGMNIYLSNENHPSSTKHYSYWSLEWLSVFALQDRQGKKRLKARMLGIDVYEERHEDSFIPWRKFSLLGANQLIPNSIVSKDYISKKHSGVHIECGYLGTKDINLKSPTDTELTIISSSRLIKLKRVSQIPIVLGKLKNKVRWNHWGSEGEELQTVMDNAKLNLGDNYYQLHAHQKDVQLLYDFYNNFSDVIFIHLSETEGLPTCLIEAACMGFPVVCTNAGGSAEVVEHGENGFVLPINFTVEEAVQVIDKLVNNEQLRIQFGAKSRALWEGKFSAQEIYPKFIDAL